MRRDDHVLGFGVPERPEGIDTSLVARGEALGEEVVDAFFADPLRSPGVEAGTRKSVSGDLRWATGVNSERGGIGVFVRRRQSGQHKQGAK